MQRGANGDKSKLKIWIEDVLSTKSRGQFRSSERSSAHVWKRHTSVILDLRTVMAYLVMTYIVKAFVL